MTKRSALEEATIRQYCRRCIPRPLPRILKRWPNRRSVRSNRTNDTWKFCWQWKWRSAEVTLLHADFSSPIFHE